MSGVKGKITNVVAKRVKNLQQENTRQALEELAAQTNKAATTVLSGKNGESELAKGTKCGNAKEPEMAKQKEKKAKGPDEVMHYTFCFALTISMLFTDLVIFCE